MQDRVFYILSLRKLVPVDNYYVFLFTKIIISTFLVDIISLVSSSTLMLLLFMLLFHVDRQLLNGLTCQPHKMQKFKLVLSLCVHVRSELNTHTCIEIRYKEDEHNHYAGHH